jgi:hypothetical protein
MITKNKGKQTSPVNNSISFVKAFSSRSRERFPKNNVAPAFPAKVTRLD